MRDKLINSNLLEKYIKKKGVDIMETKKYMTAKDVATIMEISRSSAYKIIRQLNTELEEKGFITVPGRIPRKYLSERCYY